MITITVLGSGSDGNSTLITYENSVVKQSILLDCGVPRESKMPVDWESLTGIYVTHAHSDHIRTINSVLKTKDVPVYITEGEFNGVRYPKLYDEMMYYPQDVKFVIPNVKFTDGVFTITPMIAHHDTEMPVHYLIEVDGKRIFYGCDTVDLSTDVVEVMALCDVIMIECNYDEDAINSDVLDGVPVTIPYAGELKYRIQNQGHLSLQQIRNLMLLLGDKQYIFTHISKTYNSADNINKKLYGNYYVMKQGLFPFILRNEGNKWQTIR